MPIDEVASIIEENGSHAAAYLVFPDGWRRQLPPGAWGT